MAALLRALKLTCENLAPHSFEIALAVVTVIAMCVMHMYHTSNLLSDHLGNVIANSLGNLQTVDPSISNLLSEAQGSCAQTTGGQTLATIMTHPTDKGVIAVWYSLVVVVIGIVCFHVWARIASKKGSGPLFSIAEIVALLALIPCLILQALMTSFVFKKYQFMTYTDTLRLCKLVQLKSAIETMTANLGSVSTQCSGNCLSQPSREDIVYNVLRPALPKIDQAISALESTDQSIGSMRSSPIFMFVFAVTVMAMAIYVASEELLLFAAALGAAGFVVAVAIYANTSQASTLMTAELYKKAFCSADSKVKTVLSNVLSV